ncbi:large proline-rich protein BAG6 isoform X2 [Condylostylus longicornis]|uniref:large proline-rich protein BAG6 isoform X2 n=1 Tax=Condylostylus longicornis TaxID=2530218 RepID=UPI00244DD223|nr:large proline-rich protein BAG6 isoform X2 [Condylostylus longicornis]
MINLKVKTLDSQTYDFTVDNETTVRQFKETIAEKTKISADLQRIIYCGRVLVDEKPLKDYDVNGKVVHVVERPPPSTRTLAGSSTTNENTRRRNGTQIRGTPIFRGLDGMVVGTMSIPMNGQSQGNIPTLNPSSFCMNRITVARHMLDCVNNIISYLEHPERGLNNSTLDILTQGRFTMESTVVEVGISSASNIDLTQNQTQNFMDVFRGALSAALRQDRHQNVTVLQYPNVFNSDGTPVTNPAANATISLENSLDQSQPEANTEPTGSDEQVNENATTSEQTATQTNNETPSTTSANAEPATSANDTSNNDTPNRSNTNRRSPSQQRTRTRALAEIVEQMRSVQTRLEPYVQQYYEMLDSEPIFDENDTTERENAQRIFDRVSEALHYMSHALHAISDLMLDLSQSAPRYLSCRPILVEQSGFVSSNNYLAPFMQPSNEGGISVHLPTNNNNSAQQNVSQNQSSQGSTLSPPGVGTNGNGGGGRSTTTVTPENSSNASSATTPIAGATNPQLQVARLIQAVVNSAPMDADLHVQINAPNLLSVGIPIGAAVGPGGPFSAITIPVGNQQSANNGQSSTQPNIPISLTSASNSANSSTNATETENNNQEQPRVTTATHPTTSTQTRSTPRPQVHVANMPSSWSYRDIPENMFSSFDRFLPCSSHHIRDSEQNSNTTESTNESGPSAMPNLVIPNILYRTRPQVRRRRANIFSPAVRNPAGTVGSNDTSQSASNEINDNNNSTNRPAQNSGTPNNRNPNVADEIQSLSNEELNIPMSIFGSNLTLRDFIEIAPSPNLLNRIRGELLTCIINNLFAGSTITEENMTNAINTFIQMLNDVLMFLPQFDLPDYDARASVENFLRNRIPFIINLIHEDSSDDFGTRFLRELIQFVQRLLMILVTCVGRNNAEIYLNQISQMAILSEIAEEQEPRRTLHRHLMSAITRQLDLTAQNSGEIQQYLVIRRPAPENGQIIAPNITVVPMEIDALPVTNNNNNINNNNNTSTLPANPLLEISGLTLPNPSQRPIDDPLPTVTVGSEQWHNNFPASWLPIMTRDTERQRRQAIQAPFSDAYISGMSAKRRKLISNSKSPTEVPLLIADGIKKTIQIAGVTQSTSSSSNNNGNISNNSSNTNINDISVAIASDSVTQNSYIEALRTSIQDRLKNDQNYDPKKFPNSSKYFSK